MYQDIASSVIQMTKQIGDSFFCMPQSEDRSKLAEALLHEVTQRPSLLLPCCSTLSSTSSPILPHQTLILQKTTLSLCTSPLVSSLLLACSYVEQRPRQTILILKSSAQSCDCILLQGRLGSVIIKKNRQW